MRGRHTGGYIDDAEPMSSKISDDTIAIVLAILFFAWLFVGLPWLIYPSEHIEYREATHTTPQTSKTEPKGTAQSPFFVQMIPSPKSAEERTEEAEEREEKKNADRWLVRWTAALFAATVGLIMATGVLGYFGLQQSRDMKASITAAEAANKLNQEISILHRRAWLDIVEAQLVWPSGFLEDRFVYKIQYQIENFGQTLARNVEIDIMTCYLENNVETLQIAKEKALTKARQVPIELGSTLFPNDKNARGSLSFVDGPDKFLGAMRNSPDGSRKFNVEIFITVSYRVDGDNTPHITQYIYSLLNIPIPTTIPEGRQIELKPMPFLAAVID